MRLVCCVLSTERFAQGRLRHGAWARRVQEAWAGGAGLLCPPVASGGGGVEGDDGDGAPAWLQIALAAEMPPSEAEFAVLSALLRQGQAALNEYTRFARERLGGLDALPPSIAMQLREIQAAHVHGFSALNSALLLLAQQRAMGLGAYERAADRLLQLLQQFVAGLGGAFEQRLADLEELKSLNIPGLPEVLTQEQNGWTKTSFWLKDVVSEEAERRVAQQMAAVMRLRLAQGH